MIKFSTSVIDKEGSIMKNIFLYLSIALITITCSQRNSSSKYKVVYKSDKAGNALLGSKEALIRHIRGGADIKIAWGGKGEKHSIEHISEPIWISILNESEVLIHLDPQILSEIDWENLSANYSDGNLLRQEWRVVITTKGEFDAVWYDRQNDSIIRHYPQRHVMTWYAKGCNSDVPFFQ